MQKFFKHKSVGESVGGDRNTCSYGQAKASIWKDVCLRDDISLYSRTGPLSISLTFKTACNHARALFINGQILIGQFNNITADD